MNSVTSMVAPWFTQGPGTARCCCCGRTAGWPPPGRIWFCGGQESKSARVKCVYALHMRALLTDQRSASAHDKCLYYDSMIDSQLAMSRPAVNINDGIKSAAPVRVGPDP